MRNKKVVEINRFDNFDNNSTEIKTKMFYNYAPGIMLNNSKGIASAMFPKNPNDLTEKELKIDATGITRIQGIAYFKQYFSNSGRTTYRLLVHGDDNKVYINQLLDDMYDLYWLYNLEFNKAPIVLCYKKDDEDAVILASEDVMKVWRTGYSPYTVEGVPIITSMCANDGVLFCTILDPAFKVWYATNLDAESIGTTSSGSGYISLDDNLGDARKVVAFNEEVYVFRDYGISKVNLIKNETIVSQVYQSNTKIYANTVSVCGNNILFMTKDGLYSFNGVRVNKTSVELLNNLSINNKGAVASSLGEKYYIALKMDFEDNKTILDEENCVNNVLIIIDTNNFSYEIIRGVDIGSMLPVRLDYFEKMLFTFNSGPTNKIGEIVDDSCLLDRALPKFWASENLTDSLNTKLFTKLIVNANKNIKFKLTFDDKSISFTTYKDGINEFVFKTISKDVQLEVSSEENDAIVRKVKLEYYEY